MKLVLCFIFTALFVTGGALWARRWTRPVLVVPAPARQSISLARPPAPPPSSTPIERQTSPNYRSPWEALQAEDYRAFVEELRASGCPEETVRTFTIAALSRRYIEKMEAPARAKIRASSYWQADAANGFGPDLSKQMQEARSSLDQTARELLQISMTSLRDEHWRITPDWLPEETRGPLQTLLQRQQQELQAVEARGNPGISGRAIDVDLRREWTELRERHRSELQALLGETGLAQYDARESSEANYILNHFPPAQSEEEFRLWVRAARAAGFTHADIFSDAAPRAPGSEEPRLRDRILAEVQKLSPPERSAELTEALAEQERRAQETREIRESENALRELHQMAKSGGIELSDAEAEAFQTALKQRGKELDREWWNLEQLSEEQENALKQRMREELEKVALKTLGEKGRALVDQISKKAGERP